MPDFEVGYEFVEGYRNKAYQLQEILNELIYTNNSIIQACENEKMEAFVDRFNCEYAVSLEKTGVCLSEFSLFLIKFFEEQHPYEVFLPCPPFKG